MIFLSMELDECRAKQHHFKVIGSDKTPMKRSLECITCTLEYSRPCFVAYGVDTLSSGLWHEWHLEIASRANSFPGAK